MILIGGVSVALVAIITVIRYEVLRLLSTVLPLLRTAGRAKLIHCHFRSICCPCFGSGPLRRRVLLPFPLLRRRYAGR
ncbi:MAG: hypothetical protein JWR22_1553 [Herminiimonas sp.]|nr:hypothetical protein [Herminiimonas sp.]